MTQEQSVAVYDSKELEQIGYTIKDCDPIDCKGTIYYVLKPELRRPKMNERIRELAARAGVLTDWGDDITVGRWGISGNYEQMQQFAELIVQECATVAGKDVRHFVLKHFGVE